MIFFFFVITTKMSFSQFNGVLHYESDYGAMKIIGNVSSQGGKVFTDIYESGAKARIDSKNIENKAGTTDLDSSTAKNQNVLLYNFDKQHETNLQAAFQRAIITKFLENQMQQALFDKFGSELNIQNLGAEKIGSFNCTHYLITKTSSKYKNAPPEKRDLWMTQDLGNSHIWYVGPYLYWYDGNLFQQKLQDAGANGVVVKWQVAAAKMESSGMLMSYEKRLPAKTFDIPSNYTVIDNSNFKIQ